MDQHAVVGGHLRELLKGAEEEEKGRDPGRARKKKKKDARLRRACAHLLLVMKSIMSCSSFSSVMRSLGLLLRVSTINWCRSMPVESVYSKLDSDGHRDKKNTSKCSCIS